jgi:endo-1,4-beta-D-glucanase Y
MKRNINVALGLAAAGFTLAASSVASAQSHPFPSTNVQVGNGRVTTSVLTSHELRAAYTRWQANLIRPCQGRGQRMIYPETNNDTRSEGIGYGMVIAAYMGDRPTFDGLWDFYQSHSTQGLMNWLIGTDCNTVNDGGSASDADIDAAFGLIVADQQWGGYAGDASALLQAIRTRLFDGNCNGLLTGGSNIRNCGCINPSYIPPGYYRAFGDYDDAAFWTAAINSTYTYLGVVQQDATGLVPAWSTSGGGGGLSCNPQVAGGGGTGEFQADAARTPWRVAADLLWSGDNRAAAFLAPMAQFASSAPRRITHIVDRYQLGGAPLPRIEDGNAPLNPATLNADGRRSSFTMGGFATAMTASTQENIDRFTGAWQSLYAPGDSSGQYRAFGNSLALLYGLLVTGYMWDPVGAEPVEVQEPALNAQDGNLLTNGDFDEGLLGWRIENYGTGAAQGFAVHRDGQLNIVIEGADAPENIPLYQTVAVQAGQRYLMRFQARAEEARQVRLLVQQEGGAYAVYGELGGGEEEVQIGTTLASYEWVFESTGSDPQARFKFQFGDSVADVTIDDVVFQTTDLPISIPGSVVVPEPGTPDPANPGTPTTPGGTPTTPAGMDGTIGTVNPNGDTPGSTGTPGAPGAPDPNGSTAGLPAAPTTPPGAGSCTAANPTVCAPAACSVELGLCYDPGTGYVWSPTQNTYTQPPRGVQGCAADQVYWPKFGFCYIPETGWIYNRGVMQWQFYGIDYTEGKRPPGDAGGCSVSGGVGRESGSHWLLMGLLGAALGLTYRRRAA